MNRRTPAIASDGFLEHLLLDPKMPHCFFGLLDDGTWVHFALNPDTGDYYEVHHERPHTPSFFALVFLRNMPGGPSPVAHITDPEEPRRTFVIISDGRWRSMKCLSEKNLNFFGDPAYRARAA